MIRAEHWKPSDGFVLEPNALEAATETEANLALTAGPGAGKTEMLATRRLSPADAKLQIPKAYPCDLLQGRCQHEPQGARKAPVRPPAWGTLRQLHIPSLRAPHNPAVPPRAHRAGRTGCGLLRRAGSHPGPVDYIQGHDPSCEDDRRGQRDRAERAEETYSQVFLDEFQDCTDLQYGLIKACFLGTGAQLVGDVMERQSIAIVQRECLKSASQVSPAIRNSRLPTKRRRKARASRQLLSTYPVGRCQRHSVMLRGGLKRRWNGWTLTKRRSGRMPVLLNASFGCRSILPVR